MDKMNTKLRKEKEKNENDKINNLQSGLPIIDIPSIFLDNAQLHFYEPATLLTSENRMLGLINETYGTTTKIYRLFQNYTDKYNTQSIGKSQAVYGDVDLHYGGELAITEKSIIFIHQQKGFEIKLDHIALMQPFADGIGIQSEDKVYQLLIDEPRYFIAIVNYIKNII